MFKKGDRVRVADSSGAIGSCNVGDVFEVLRVEADDYDSRCDLVYFRENDAMFAHRFEHAPLTVEAGKFYITRDGRRVGPTEKYLKQCSIKEDASGRRADFYVSGQGSYTRAGVWLAGEPECEHDLVAEAPAYTSNAAAQSDNLADEYGGGKKAKFKVGDRVRVIAPKSDCFDMAGTVRHVESDSNLVEFNGGGGGHNGTLSGLFFEGDNCYWLDDDYLVPAGAADGHAIVAVIEDGQPKPATRPYVHTDRAAAKAEAERLAGVNKGKTFGVYELVDEAKVERVYDHEWQRLAVDGNYFGAANALSRLSGIDYDTAFKTAKKLKAA